MNNDLNRPMPTWSATRGISQTDDHEQILTIVRSWSAAQRFTLVQEVLSTLAPTEAPQHTAASTLERARGLFAAGASAPSDEEIARWLGERRSERYGV